MRYTDTPCGRCIARAEEDLGPLSEGQKADLLLDNFPELANFQEAVEMVRTVTIKGEGL